MYKQYAKVTERTMPGIKRIRIAAYACVSSDKDAMLNSLSSQVSHYSALIQGNPRQQLAGVYAEIMSTTNHNSRRALARRD